MGWKGKIVSLITLFLIIMVAWYVMKIGNTIPKYWDFGARIPQHDQMIGIDVSHYQGQIYWDEVDQMKIEGDSLRFAYLKASEGINLIDAEFKNNLESIQRTDLNFGAYHYYHPSASSLEQAQHFCTQLKNSEFTLKPVIDVEITGDLTNNALKDSIVVFLDFVEKELGSRPLIYTYESFYKDYIVDELRTKELFWIASYNETCGLYENENVLMWQFTDKGTVNGIGPKVDLNLAKPQSFEKIKK